MADGSWQTVPWVSMQPSMHGSRAERIGRGALLLASLSSATYTTY